MHRIDNLLSYDSILSSAPPNDETSLERANDAFKKGTNTGNNNFGDDIINEITKTYWPKILKLLWMVNFRDKDTKGLHNLIFNLTLRKGITNQLPHIILDNIQYFLKK